MEVNSAALTVYSCTALMSTLRAGGRLAETVEAFEWMRGVGVQPNKYVISE